jgi:hypothetical protein
MFEDKLNDCGKKNLRMKLKKNNEIDREKKTF